MIKKITTGTGKYLAIRVPNDVQWTELLSNELGAFINKALRVESAQFFQCGKTDGLARSIYYSPDTFYLPKGNWEIINYVDELTEEDWEKIVDKMANLGYVNYMHRPQDVDGKYLVDNISVLRYAESSGLSLLTLHDISTKDRTVKWLLLKEKK